MGPMSTRTIVTSQPDVACDVCERRLLRGEQTDIFIAAGRRLTVCELCAPRAANEGWMREGDGAQVALPPLRPRRGRSFLERLPAALRTRGPARQRLGHVEGHDPAAGGEHAEPAAAFADWAAAEGFAGDEHAAPVAAAGSEPAAEPGWVERAVDVFNASEFPRRVAGVARSLGAPEVSVRSAEHLESVVVIVVAWELCWYRYEVDLSEPPGEARQLAQGSELGELPRDDRLANALASDGGTLVLAAPTR
jgi:hypothetical protein